MTADEHDRPSAEKPTETTPSEAASAVRERVAEEHPEKPTPKPRAAVVYNPVKVDKEVLQAAVSAAEEAAGWRESLWFETEEDDPGHSMAREAVAAEVDMIVAAGGDGTVRVVAEEVAGTGVALGLLPAGTGNILARNLELSLDNLEEALTTAFTGDERPVDVGVVELRRPDDSRETHRFVVMAGVGLDAQMISNTDDELKKKVGWLAYVQAIMRSVRSGQQVRMRWQLDDGTRHSAHVHTLMIGNCGSLPGNVLLLPDAAVDDGVLDIIALRPEGPLGWLQVWAKVIVENGILRRHEVGQKFAGPKNSVRALRYQHGKKLDVQLLEPQAFELDGDEFGEVLAFRVSVEPRSLLVKVPAA